MRRRMTNWRYAAATLPMLLLVVVVLAGCRTSEGGGSGDGVLEVVTTTSMLADLAREVGGEHVTVTGLMGPGVDPHLYQASAGDVARIAGADVLLYNGLHLEGKMTEVFAQMRRRELPTMAVAERAVPESLRVESPDYAGNYDPHVWFDVGLWQRAARVVAGELARLDSTHADAYRANAEAYAEELGALDEEVRRQIEQLPLERRVLITSHDAFSYFGQAYDFEVRGLQGISTATEAGTADVRDLAAFIVERRIPALFVESSVSPRGIEAVRAAVRDRGFDVRLGGTLYGDALGTPGTPEGAYTGMMRHNVATIVQGLRDDAPAS